MSKDGSSSHSDSEDAGDKVQVARKVFQTTIVQLAFTFLLAYIASVNKDMGELFKNPMYGVVTFVMFVVLLTLMLCSRSLRISEPYNLVILAFLTFG